MKKIAILMDDIEQIHTYKDTSFALMLAAQARQFELWYFQQKDWQIRDGKVFADLKKIHIQDKKEDYYQIEVEETRNLAEFDVVLQRKDPPFNLNYIYDSYMLDLLSHQGVKVINPPQALRDINEKFAISYFPEVTPPTLITKSKQAIREFLHEHKQAVLKPLDGMGGMGIFKLSEDDKNTSAILDTMNPNDQETLMVQGFIPEVTAGDKRILIIHGEAVDHGLARIPKSGEFRANLAAGGHGIVQPLTQREWQVVDTVLPFIKQHKLALVGLDVIGGHVTEINITSPTCMREIEDATGQDLAGKFWDELQSQKV